MTRTAADGGGAPLEATARFVESTVRLFRSYLETGLTELRDSSLVVLAVVPLVTALFRIDNLLAIAGRGRLHVGATVGLPAPVVDAWALVDAPLAGTLLPSIGALVLVTFVQGLLAAGYLGSIAEAREGIGFTFLPNVAKYGGRMLAFAAVWLAVTAALPLVAVAAGGLLGVALTPVVLAVSVAVTYGIWAAPYLVVEEDLQLGAAVARSLEYATESDRYLRFSLAYATGILAVSVVATLLLANLWIVGALLAVVLAAPAGLLLNVATAAFVGDLVDGECEVPAASWVDARLAADAHREPAGSGAEPTTTGGSTVRAGAAASTPDAGRSSPEPESDGHGAPAGPTGDRPGVEPRERETAGAAAPRDGTRRAATDDGDAAVRDDDDTAGHAAAADPDPSGGDDGDAPEAEADPAGDDTTGTSGGDGGTPGGEERSPPGEPSLPEDAPSPADAAEVSGTRGSDPADDGAAETGADPTTTERGNDRPSPDEDSEDVVTTDDLEWRGPSPAAEAGATEEADERGADDQESDSRTADDGEDATDD